MTLGEPFLASLITNQYIITKSAAALRQAFFEMPAAEQAALLDDLIVGSCDAAWEARLAPEMEARVDAVERGEMRLREAAEIFGERRFSLAIL